MYMSMHMGSLVHCEHIERIVWIQIQSNIHDCALDTKYAAQNDEKTSLNEMSNRLIYSSETFFRRKHFH